MGLSLFIFEAVCSLEYAHAMNISHHELTWPTGLQQEVQEDHRAKLRAAQRGAGGTPKTAADSGNHAREVGEVKRQQIHDPLRHTP